MFVCAGTGQHYSEALKFGFGTGRNVSTRELLVEGNVVDFGKFDSGHDEDPQRIGNRRPAASSRGVRFTAGLNVGEYMGVSGKINSG